MGESRSVIFRNAGKKLHDPTPNGGCQCLMLSPAGDPPPPNSSNTSRSRVTVWDMAKPPPNAPATADVPTFPRSCAWLRKQKKAPSPGLFISLQGLISIRSRRSRSGQRSWQSPTGTTAGDPDRIHSHNHHRNRSPWTVSPFPSEFAISYSASQRKGCTLESG